MTTTVLVVTKKSFSLHRELNLFFEKNSSEKNVLYYQHCCLANQELLIRKPLESNINSFCCRLPFRMGWHGVWTKRRFTTLTRQPGINKNTTPFNVFLCEFWCYWLKSSILKLSLEAWLIKWLERFFISYSQIDAFDYNQETGSISNRRTAVKIDPSHGVIFLLKRISLLTIAPCGFTVLMYKCSLFTYALDF